MAWLILEGIDRSGKSSVAELYKKQGYQIVHMSAPDKKYAQPGYAGPSYLDDLIDIYMACNAKDVVFDRSPYGETVWPYIYGRESRLNDDDFEVLRELEDSNSTTRIWMSDPDVAAHWKRCVDNKEPLNKNQFNQANLFYERMAAKFGFEKKQLSDFVQLNAVKAVPEEKNKVETTTSSVTATSNEQLKNLKSPEQFKLEKANAINDILSKRIVKSKGDIYDGIEKEIREFLNKKLGTLFGGAVSDSFSSEEVEMLKIYCKQLKRKLETKQ